MTSPSWALQDRQASMVLGLDVLALNRYRPDRGRSPVGCSLPVGSGPVTSVIPLDVVGRVPYRYHGFLDHVLHSGSQFLRSTTANYTPSTGSLSDVNLGGVASPAPGLDRVLVRRSLSSYTPGAHVVVGAVSGTIWNLFPNLEGGSFVRTVYSRGSTWFAVDDLSSAEGLTDSRTYFVKNYERYQQEGPWTEDFVGVAFQVNEDGRAGTARTSRVEALGSFAQPGDSLILEQTTGVFNEDTFVAGTKFSMSLVLTVSLQGFLVSNVRKFWLCSDGTYTEVFDLQDDDFLSTVWKGTTIANNRLLLVSPSHAPRVYHFSRKVLNQSLAGEESLAGMIPPVKPEIEKAEEGAVRSVGWLQANLAAQGSLTASGAGRGIQTLVRLVNLEDRTASDLIPVVDSNAQTVPTDDAGTTLKTVVVANDGVSVFSSINSDELIAGSPEGWTPPIHGRSTFLEIWRTKSNEATVYQRETRVVMAGPGQESTTAPILSWLDPTPTTYPIRLADEDVIGLSLLTDSERSAHGLPPICRDVVSLLGTTLCFGAAAEDPVFPVVYGVNFYTLADADYNPANGEVFFPNAGNYRFKAGDQVVFPHENLGHSGVPPVNVDPHPPAGAYDITGSPASGTATIATGLTPVTVLTSTAYIRRPYRIDYPVIESDEDIWYSRTDDFAPESFPSRVKTLSRIGDRYRKAVILGKYCVVVMEQGVHLLFLDGTTLQVSTVEHFGAGTPWGDSVLVYQDKVLWATAQGISILTVRPEPDISGRRGFIERQGQKLEAWFRETATLNESIDAGMDAFRQAIRWRRKKTDGTYQVLQWSTTQNRFTFLDDDNGLRYVSSAFAEPGERSIAPLYSVEPETGAVFRVNPLDDPYQGLKLQDQLLTPWLWSATHIRYPGTAFSSKLIGEVLRFRHTNGSETVRTILTADEEQITFASVPFLTQGDTFVIAATRFRVRYRLPGKDPLSVKTLHEVTLRAIPGDREDTPVLTLRAYEDFSTQPVASATLSTRDEATLRDRVALLSAQGSDLELEIESLDARNDFDLNFLEAVVLEEPTRA